MSQLIQIRTRIKAVETIKKITHAMRLIAMSTHMRLRDKQPTLQEYTVEIERLFMHMQAHLPNWNNPIFNPPKNNKSLFILIGSQKGLCGSFNDALCAQFQKQWQRIDQKTTDIVTAGKKASEYVAAQNIPIIKQWDVLTSPRIMAIAHEITNFIVNAPAPYSTVTMLSNYPKTFFSQSRVITHLIPIDADQKLNQHHLENYQWYQNPIAIIEHIAQLYITTKIELRLFESLLAEQAARFVSMDSSTRNAKEVLDTMHLQYNKLRQAKITKELTELSSSFQTNVGS